MPAEPERDIEKTLKAYAERRRQQAGAPLELHPATRRMLQAEAARHHSRKPQNKGFWSLMAGFVRRRFVLVSALTAMVLAIALTLVPALTRVKRQQMASYQALDGTSRKEPAPAPSAGTGELAKAKTYDHSLADKKVASDGVTTTGVAEAPIVALDQAANEKQKDIANPALNVPATATSAEPLSINRTDSARVAPLAQNAVAAPNSSLEGGIGGRPVGQAQASSLASATTDQRAGEFRQAFPATNAFAFKDQAAPIPSQRDELKLGGPIASPPPATFAAQSPPASAPSGAVAAPAPALALSDSESAGAVTQRFYRLSGNTLKATTSASRTRGVLDSFRVEQSGGTMRVIDGDGSVYSGFVQVSDQSSQQSFGSGVAAARELESVQQTQSAAKAVTIQPTDALSAPAASQNYFFRVTGTNRTSRQPIIFSGTITPVATQVTGVRTGAQSRVVGGLTPAAPSPGALPLSRAQLRGRALIGGTNAIDVNAAPSPQ